MNFHFYAQVMTALVPIDIPKGSPNKAGDLVAFGNLRTFRNDVIFYLREKALLPNKLSQKIVSFRAL